MKDITIHIDDYERGDGTPVSGYDKNIQVRDLTEEELAQREDAKARLEGEIEEESTPSNIKVIEEEIKNNKFETAIIYTDSGDVLLNKKGKKNSVDITFIEMAQLGGLEGKNLTHNHPIETSFSAADVKMFLNNRLSKMRAVTKNNKYELVSKGIKMSPKEVDKVINDYKRYSRLTRIRLTSQFYDGKITEKEFGDTFDHNIMLELSKDYKDKFTYSKK